MNNGPTNSAVVGFAKSVSKYFLTYILHAPSVLKVLCLSVLSTAVFGCGNDYDYRTTARLNLRECPEASERCHVMTTLPKGGGLYLIERRGEWYFVKAADYGRKGWVHGAYVAEARSSATTGGNDDFCLSKIMVGALVLTIFGTIVAVMNGAPRAAPLAGGLCCAYVAAPIAFSQDPFSVSALLTPFVVGLAIAAIFGIGGPDQLVFSVVSHTSGFIIMILFMLFIYFIPYPLMVFSIASKMFMNGIGALVGC